MSGDLESEGYYFREVNGEAEFPKEEGMYHPDFIGHGNGFDYRPLICKCGNKAFEVFFPQDYHTAVKCLECGNYETVHMG